MPETLLKKRKSDVKAREEKLAKAAELRKVSIESDCGSGNRQRLVRLSKRLPGV